MDATNVKRNENRCRLKKTEKSNKVNLNVNVEVKNLRKEK